MRDRLIELIVNIENEIFRQRNYFTDMERIEQTADILIAHGVTLAEDNNVLSKKPVVYSVTRGALCPTCDGELDCRFTIKGFWRDKHITARVKSKFCGHCGQPLDWSNNPKEVE